ncbi:M17 family metallopeptidase [Candidatus Bipolaricaulota bacterium]
MKIEARVANVETEPCDLLILWGTQTDGSLDEAGWPVDLLSDDALSAVLTLGDFHGKLGEHVVVYPGGGAAKRLLVVGLGPYESFDLESMREAAGAAARAANALNAKDVLVSIPAVAAGETTKCKLIEALIIGARLALYRYPRNSTTTPIEDALRVDRLTLATDPDDVEEIRESVAAGIAIAEAAIFVRTWVNHPANVATATALQSAASDFADSLGLNCTILDHAALLKENMGLFLAVAQGAKDAARMIVLEHNPPKRSTPDAGPVVLVGKGILFDTGGYSLKGRDTMLNMSSDMAGSAVVLGVMQAVARLKLPLHVIALAPIVENLIGPEAYRPDDVFYAKNGKSVEIRSTDAEGRLILADALCYADTLKPSAVIDVATLTGSKNAALGPRTNALFASDDALAEALLKASGRSGEPLWRMPLDPAYDRQLKSQVADLKNTGGKLAGTITAARFLAQFVGTWPWSHIDIAGSARYGTGSEYTPRSYLTKGGTDIPMRTLVEYLRKLA